MILIDIDMPQMSPLFHRRDKGASIERIDVDINPKDNFNIDVIVEDLPFENYFERVAPLGGDEEEDKFITA